MDEYGSSGEPLTREHYLARAREWHAKANATNDKHLRDAFEAVAREYQSRADSCTGEINKSDVSSWST